MLEIPKTSGGLWRSVTVKSSKCLPSTARCAPVSPNKVLCEGDAVITPLQIVPGTGGAGASECGAPTEVPQTPAFRC